MSDSTPPVPPVPPGGDAQPSAAPPPAAAPGAPPAPAQPVYGQPVYGQPAYGQQQPQYGQPAYAQPAYAQPAYAQPYVTGPRTNTLALVAMILSLVGIVSGATAIGGIVCGHIALSQLKRTGENGRGMALTGVIVGYVIVGLWALFIVAYIVFLVVVLGAAAASSSPSFR